MISVFIPAFNEEKNIRNTVETTINAAQSAGVVDLEIIIVDDGSTDGTQQILAALATEYACIRTIYFAVNQGLGVAFTTAIQMAKGEKLATLPGDNFVTAATITDMFRYAHVADVVMAFTLNTEHRSIRRHIVSMIFSMCYLLTFNIHLKQINSLLIMYRTQDLKDLQLTSTRYSIFPEILVKLLRQGRTFYEFAGCLNTNQNTSSAIKLKNLVEALRSYASLLYTVYIKDAVRFSKRPIRITQDRNQ